MTKPNQTNTGGSKQQRLIGFGRPTSLSVYIGKSNIFADFCYSRFCLASSQFGCFTLQIKHLTSKQTSVPQTRLTCIACTLVRAIARSIVFSGCPSVRPSVPPLLSQYLCDGSREFSSKFEPTRVLWTKVKHTAECFLPRQRFLQRIRQLNQK